MRYLSFAVVCAASLSSVAPAFAAKGYSKLDEMALDRWALLRETERYQLNIAEKYYREQNWKAAADEYEKFLTLYESSEGAPYAQLKWSHCQVRLKKLNTAVKDGYQSVIDYWPDSPEAVAAAYLIGKTYKDMGDLGPAKQAYQKLLSKHADEMVAILTRLDLADIARIEQNRPERIAAFKDLVFNAPRTGDAGKQIVEASKTLAVLLFDDGAFVEGKDALATSYQEPTLSGQVLQYVVGPIRTLVAATDDKDRGLKLADAALAYFREQQSAAPEDDEGARAKQLAYYMADVEGAAGRTDAASKIFDGLLKAHPGDDDVLAHYGDWLKNQKRRDEARAVYGRMKDPVAGQSRIAYSYREENKHLSAAPIYEQLMSSDAGNAARWQWLLADAYREGGKYKEAIGVYQQTDNYPENLRLMASCYRQLKQYHEAIGLYTQIVGAYEQAAPSALLQIGYTQEQDGKSEAAIATLQQVCKRFPKTSEAAQAHQHLNNKYKITVTLGGAKDE